MQNWWSQFNRSEFCSKLVWNFCGSISRTSEKMFQWDFLSVWPNWIGYGKNHVKSVGFFFRFTSLMPKYENVMDLIIIIIHVGLNVQNLQGQQLTGPESILYTQKIILDDRSFTFCKTVCIYVRICSSRRLNLFFQTCLLRCLLDDSLHKYLPKANDSACTLYENHAKCIILQHCEQSELTMYFGDPTKRGKNM